MEINNTNPSINIVENPPQQTPPTHPPVKNKKIFIVLGMLLLLTVFLSGTIYLLNQRRAPLGMLVYKDPDNYFSLFIPFGWKAEKTTGTMTSEGATQKVEIVTLRSPDNIFVNIQVYEGKPSCTTKRNYNATLAGLPASYNETRGLWLVDTKKATFSINYIFPGANIAHSSPMRRVGDPTATPAPESETNTYQQEVNTIINSFLPNDLRKLSC